MRLNAAIATILVVASVVGLSRASAFADTTDNAGTAPAQNYVTVQEGDTLSAIADNNATTYVRIFDANQQIQDPDLIYPGEVVRIPAADEQLTDRVLPESDQATTPDQESSESAPVDNSQTQTVTATGSQTAVAGGSIWDELAQCESGGNWSIDTGNGYYGGLQFTLSSWQAVGGSGYPNQASQDEQIMRAQMLQQVQGWAAWPVCSVEIGL